VANLSLKTAGNAATHAGIPVSGSRGSGRWRPTCGTLDVRQGDPETQTHTFRFGGGHGRSAHRYVRVSSLDQNEKRQLEGQVLDRVFTDKASGRDTSRLQLTELLRFAWDGDTVVVHSMDRLARNLDDLRALVQGLTRRGVRVGAFAEFERSLIRERQRESIALAQQRGVYKGRKKTLTSERAAELVQRAGSGIPKAVLAREYGISRETVYQYIRLANVNSKPFPPTQLL